jgi:hypothetical protein
MGQWRCTKERRPARVGHGRLDVVSGSSFCTIFFFEVELLYDSGDRFTVLLINDLWLLLLQHVILLSTQPGEGIPRARNLGHWILVRSDKGCPFSSLVSDFFHRALPIRLYAAPSVGFIPTRQLRKKN